MKQHFDLQKHIEQGVAKIVADTIKATLKNPKEAAFMAKFALASQKASKIRMEYENAGLHVPGFLIASITSACNLHCAGCYSRFNHATLDAPPVQQLSVEEWKNIFMEADEPGISFIMLAGGKETTDERRGEGIYDKAAENMEKFRRKGLIFGASITVTTENYQEVTSRSFVQDMMDKGCRLIIYVEFVPVTEEAAYLAPGDEERRITAENIEQIRSETGDIVLLSFPGDELAMGGCMAAGREFFHINSHGGAEPCPFSPYSDINVRDTSLKEAIASPLFQKLQDQGVLSTPHVGGCVLFENRETVETLAEASQS